VEGYSVASQEEQAIYSIGAVAHMLDVPTSTLRGWEERYGVVTPNRSHGSQRLYSRSQVEQLRFIKTQMEAGNSAADAHRLLTQHMSGGPVRLSGAEPKGERRILILLAERDSYAADLAEYFLRTEGYDVCIALDATQARLLFDKRSPDLVVIDLLISGGAGFRLCAEFTAKGSAPVLAVASIDQPDEAMLSGAAAFLPKPLEPLKLVSAVRDLLGTSALVRSARRQEVAP
jgi:DNA-binding transcriptional MerR regulator